MLATTNSVDVGFVIIMCIGPFALEAVAFKEGLAVAIFRVNDHANFGSKLWLSLRYCGMPHLKRNAVGKQVAVSRYNVSDSMRKLLENPWININLIFSTQQKTSMVLSYCGGNEQEPLLP